MAKPTTLPWAVHIDPAFRYPGFENFETYHPLFLYESLVEFRPDGLAALAGTAL